jgi:hypothetical protein
LFVVSATLLAFGTYLSLPESIRATSSDVQIIEITAKKYDYSNSPVHVKVGTKSFKIVSAPDGASCSEKAGLVFTSEQECWQLRRGKRP